MDGLGESHDIFSYGVTSGVSEPVVLSSGLLMEDPRLIAHHGISPTLGADVFVADTARIIGDVEIGDHSSIWYGSVGRGDVHHVRIGDRVNIQDLSVIHVTAGRYGTCVEDDVTVGHRALLHGCTVKQGALVGMGAVVMDQVVVGEWSMVGAGALVPPGAVIPPRTLAVGSPARVRRELTSEELDWLKYSAAHYRDLAVTYMAQGHGVVGGSK